VVGAIGGVAEGIVEGAIGGVAEGIVVGAIGGLDTIVEGVIGAG
jgi:hypothetical protein